jgi:uncharacterized OB-fold protein
MSDFGECKGCGRVYSLTRLKACPRCGDTEINFVEEVRIPTTVKNDLTSLNPETADESDLTNVIHSELPITTPCKNCGREFRSDKLDSCPSCGTKVRNSIETRTVKNQPHSVSISEQRRVKETKDKKFKSLVIATSSIFIILILGALLLKGISSGSPAPIRNEENVDSNQGTVTIVKKCYTQWLPNPAYDPTDIMSNKEYPFKVCP